MKLKNIVYTGTGIGLSIVLLNVLRKNKAELKSNNVVPSERFHEQKLPYESVELSEKPYVSKYSHK